MRRAVARGRVFPQSFSTDRRYGRLSLKACALFPLMWANADDQGRLCGDPEEVKYAVCPNIDHITKADIPELLDELERNSLIKIYETPKSDAVQVLDWWEVNHKLQWAWPSDYPPPGGWQDRLRYKRGAKEVVTQNWPSSGESHNNSQVSEANISGEHSGETSEKPSSFPHTPIYYPENEKEEENKRGRGRGRGKRNSPEFSGELSGETPSPSPIATSLLDNFPKAFGREPNSREAAMMRDIELEISAAGATPEQIVDAYKEAAKHNKLHLSYVWGIIDDWLGIERNRSP